MQGGTLYPGLMLTAAAAYHMLHALHLTVSIRLVCVFLAPVFAGITAMCVFALGREVTLGPRGDERYATPAATAALYRKANAVGLVSAAFAAIVPGYISRSVAGSYDNEGVAIFALIITFYLWTLALNTGSVVAATVAALSYFYMVGAWGGYVFIINILPIHALVLLVGGRYSIRLYTAFSVFYVVGTLLSMQVGHVRVVVVGGGGVGGCRASGRGVWRRRCAPPAARVVSDGVASQPPAVCRPTRRCADPVRRVPARVLV
jgi:dolichyl-diphosphooligosaccharide---protein glycosyltransferase